MATSTCPHCHCLTSGHSRGSKMSSGTDGRDMTCPPAEMNLHCPPGLLISVADTWWQGWGKELPRLKRRQGDLSGRCREGAKTSHCWMLATGLCCFCSSSVGMVNEKVVKGSEFPQCLTVSAFPDPCWSGYRQSGAQRLHCTGSPGYR